MPKEGIFIRIDFLIDQIIEEIELANIKSYKTHVYLKWAHIVVWVFT